jgi:ketosteroid isomerase-like protein
MDPAGFGRWLDAYGRAWISNSAPEVAALFSEDAVYYYEPFRRPARGRESIVRAWFEGGRSQREPTFEHEVLAVSGRTGIAHWRAGWMRDGAASARIRMDGVLVAVFDDEGRCREHREWYSVDEEAVAGSLG